MRSSPALRASRSSSGARLPSLEQKELIGRTGAARRFLRGQSEPGLPDDLCMDTPGPGAHEVGQGSQRYGRDKRVLSYSFGCGEARF
jgi:hypothetical protein